MNTREKDSFYRSQAVRILWIISIVVKVLSNVRYHGLLLLNVYWTIICWLTVEILIQKQLNPWAKFVFIVSLGTPKKCSEMQCTMHQMFTYFAFGGGKVTHSSFLSWGICWWSIASISGFDWRIGAQSARHLHCPKEAFSSCRSPPL